MPLLVHWLMMSRLSFSMLEPTPTVNRRSDLSHVGLLIFGTTAQGMALFHRCSINVFFSCPYPMMSLMRFPSNRFKGVKV